MWIHGQLWGEFGWWQENHGKSTVKLETCGHPWWGSYGYNHIWSHGTAVQVTAGKVGGHSW